MKVLVIGGSSGYGKGVVDVLNQHGEYEAVSASRSSKDICDVRNWWHVEDLAKTVEHQSLRAVVYSVGIAKGLNHITNGEEENWIDVFETNTIGLLRVIRSFIEKLQIGGIFIHIGSIANTLNYAGGADYCASKAASSTIMRTLRHELLGTGIRTTSIEPGLGNTNFQFARFPNDPERAAQVNEGIRVIQPEDIGWLVKYLIEAPPHLNFDEIVIKPLDQATHGKTTKDK